MRITRLLILIILAVLLESCAKQDTVQNVTRYRSWNFDSSAASGEARAAFIPKGAYIIASTEQAVPDKSWVRLIPGGAWPAEEPRPTLLIGRVSERTKTAARLEILSLQHGMRDTHPRFEVYPIQDDVSTSLHAITKRIAFATSSASGDRVQTTLSQASLIQGNEIYGAFDVSASQSNERLAASNMALMTVSSSGTAENIQLAISAGNLPKSPVFVLLDAPQKPAFDVRILTGSIANRAQVLEHIRQMLAKGLPGSNHIRVEAQKTDVDVQKLGGIQTEILDAALIETDKGTVILDQAIRVNDSPWTVVLSSADEKLKAAAVVARSLEMLGYPASQAFLLEEIYAEASASQRAAIGPALAQAYHVMERDDWALELGLELLSASGLQSKETMHEMQTAASIVFAITGRASEFASTIHEVSGFITKLSPSWQKSFAHAMLQSQDLARWHDYYTVSRHSFNEFDEMLECLNTEDQDICESNLENSKTELGQLWYQTMLISAKSPAPEHLELAKKADRIGAPNLGMKLWAAILSTGLTAEASQGAWINMAQYARRAQQTRTFLHLMADYEYHQAPYANELYAEAVSGWRSLDYRAEIAHSCVSRASTAGDESVDLLQLAAELYISMGDAENTAIVYAKLSRIYEERGQADTASQYLNMARSFARETHQKEVLTAIEGEINNASE